MNVVSGAGLIDQVVRRANCICILEGP